MKKPQPTSSHSELLRDLRQLITQARSLTVKNVNSVQVLSNLLIGRRIVEEEQGGQDGRPMARRPLNNLH